MKANISILEDSSAIVVTVDDTVVFKKTYVKIAIKSVNGIVDGNTLTIPVDDPQKLSVDPRRSRAARR